MEKLALICQIQTTLSGHRDLVELRPRAALSFNEEELVVQYRHPVTGKTEVLVVGTLQEVMREEQRISKAIVSKLRKVKIAGG